MNTEINYNRIIFQRSNTPSEVPTIPVSDPSNVAELNGLLPTDILPGEIFVNTADNKAWIRTGNQIYELTSNAGSGNVTITINNNSYKVISAPGTENILVFNSELDPVGYYDNINDRYIISDSSLYVNGDLMFDNEAEVDFNLIVKNTNGTPVGSKVGNEWIVPATTTCKPVEVYVNGILNGSYASSSEVYLTVKDKNGNDIGVMTLDNIEVDDNVISVNGVTYATIQPETNLNVIVKDADGTPVGSLVSGEWIVPSSSFTDVDISINNTLIGNYGSGSSVDITVKDSDGNSIGNISNEDVTILDSEINVNGSKLTDLKAQETLNLNIIDTNSNPVGTLNGNDTVVVPASGGLSSPDRFVGMFNGSISYSLFDFNYKGGGNHLIDETIDMLRNSDNMMYSLAIGNTPNKYLAGCQIGTTIANQPIRITTDGGTTWTASLTQTDSRCVGIYSMPNDRDIVYACTVINPSSIRIHKSTDGGDTWTTLQQYSGGLVNLGSGGKRLSDNYLYIGLGGNSSTSVAYIINLTNDTISSVTTSITSDAHINDVAYSPTLNLTVAVYGGAITNGGIGYTSGVSGGLTTQLTSARWVSVEWVPFLDMFIAIRNTSSNGGEIYTSTDGINWTLRLSTGALVSVFDYGPTVLYTSDNKVFIASGVLSYTSTDGINWTEIVPLIGTTLHQYRGKIRKATW